VEHKQRHKRLRLLIGKLNKERKKQAKKIDILCKDFIAAQRDFIKRLNTISFTADFYESIIGTGDLNMLLYTASTLIKEKIADAKVTSQLLLKSSVWRIGLVPRWLIISASRTGCALWMICSRWVCRGI